MSLFLLASLTPLLLLHHFLLPALRLLLPHHPLLAPHVPRLTLLLGHLAQVIWNIIINQSIHHWCWTKLHQNLYTQLYHCPHTALFNPSILRASLRASYNFLLLYKRHFSTLPDFLICFYCSSSIYVDNESIQDIPENSFHLFHCFPNWILKEREYCSVMAPPFTHIFYILITY